MRKTVAEYVIDQWELTLQAQHHDAYELLTECYKYAKQSEIDDNWIHEKNHSYTKNNTLSDDFIPSGETKVDWSKFDGKQSKQEEVKPQPTEKVDEDFKEWRNLWAMRFSMNNYQDRSGRLIDELLEQYNRMFANTLQDTELRKAAEKVVKVHNQKIKIEQVDDWFTALKKSIKELEKELK